AERQYTPFQAARSAGVSVELATRFWRAMGFADIGQAKALTEADVLALRRLAGLVEAGLLSEPMAIQVARSTGQTTARLADWQIDSFLEGLTEPHETGSHPGGAVDGTDHGPAGRLADRLLPGRAHRAARDR
ncbi:hypothetical protein AB4Z54_71735, partial [Streptomyces sp. MCAF7]